MSTHYGEVDPYSEGGAEDPSAGVYQNDPNEGVYQTDPNAGVYQAEATPMEDPTNIIDESMPAPDPVSNGSDFPSQNEFPTANHPMYSSVAPPARSGISAVASDLSALANAASTGDATTIMNAMEQFSKSQLVRFLDISVIGPLLLMWAYRGNLSKGERALMGVIGAGTVIYNGRNYLKNKKIVSPAQVKMIKNQLSTAANYASDVVADYVPEVVQEFTEQTVTPEVVDPMAGYYGY